MDNDQKHMAEQFGQAWDAHQANSSMGHLDDELFEIIQRLEMESSQATLPAERLDTIWSTVMVGSVQDMDVPTAPDTGLTALLVRINRTTQRFAWIIFAGLLGGFVAGIGSRLVMRVAGFLTVERNRSFLTDNHERVGEITLGGTLALGIIGAALGVLALLFYIAIRNRLPFSGWRRSATFAAILLLVFGYVVMDPGNPDYERFGPAWLNIVMFSSIYLIMGFCVSMIYEFGRSHGRSPGKPTPGPFWFAVRMAVNIAVCLVGIVFMVPALFIAPTYLLIPGLAAIAWLVSNARLTGWLDHIAIPGQVRHWGAWAIPGAVGILLTIRGVFGILMG